MKNYLRLLKGHSHPARFLAARLLMATGLNRLFTIRMQGYSLRFHRSNVSMYRWIAPTEQDHELEFFRAYLKPGDTVIDVGANIGETVLTASAAVGDSGTVLAFEPHPRTFDFLCQNLALNQTRNVVPHNLGLGEKSGRLAFTDDRRDDLNRVVDGGETLQVRIERLDDLAPRGPVQLLKVDVEGYEKFVFAGAPELLTRTECVYFEVCTPHLTRYGYSTRQLLEIFSQRAFELFRIASPRHIAAIPPSFESPHYENLIALRQPEDFRRRTGWKVDGL